MNSPQDLTVTIPATIAAMPGLTLAERATLAHVAKFPGCSNRSLAELLGVSVRGAESVLRRLRARGLIRPVGEGRARRLVLMFTVEPHTSCGKSENEESHTECVVDQSGLAVAKPEMSTGDFVAMRLSCSENCFEVGRYEAARLHVEAARERLELDADIPAEQKAKLLTALKQREDQLFAFEVGEQMVDGLPTRKVRELALTLCRASPENLSMFRERVVAGAFLSNREGVLALIGG